METSLKMAACAAIATVKPFLSGTQFSELIVKCAGGESEFYRRTLVALKESIDALTLSENSAVGANPMAYLHYYGGTSHWYIVGIADDGLPGGRRVRTFVGHTGQSFQDCGLVLLQGIFHVGGDTLLDLFFKPCPLTILKTGLDFAEADDVNTLHASF